VRQIHAEMVVSGAGANLHKIIILKICLVIAWPLEQTKVNL